jgi:hypothetical protein
LPREFCRDLRVLRAGCNTLTLTIYGLVVNNQFSAPDDCTIDHQFRSWGQWMACANGASCGDISTGSEMGVGILALLPDHVIEEVAIDFAGGLLLY